VLAQACRAVQGTVAKVEQRILGERNTYVRRSSERDWLLARRHAQILREAVEVHLAFQLGNMGIRDRLMAENIQWIAGDEGPGTRMMIWAQNDHVSRGVQMMGRRLKDLFPRDFVNFGFAFGEGSFQAIDGIPAAGQSRRLASFTVGPPSPNSMDGVLASAGLPLFVLDIRRADGAVADWFRSGHATRAIGGVFVGESAMPIRIVPDRYDMLVFVDRTSRAEPVR
jgi:erythromycin esterase